jgi:hypothetical protein
MHLHILLPAVNAAAPQRRHRAKGVSGGGSVSEVLVTVAAKGARHAGVGESRQGA